MEGGRIENGKTDGDAACRRWLFHWIHPWVLQPPAEEKMGEPYENPGLSGVDFDTAKELGLRVVWALSLPGKVAPISAAEIIRDTVFNMLQEQSQ